MNRREKNRLEAIRKAEQIKKETEERKTNRANLREKLRIYKIEQIVQKEILSQAPLVEWKPSIQVLDVRQYIAESYETNISNISGKSPQGIPGSIYVLGGMIGEIIVTLNCLQDVIRAKPDQANFIFTQQDLENYFMAVFAGDSGFTTGAVSLDLLSNPELVKVEKEPDESQGEDKNAEGQEEEGSVWEEQPLTNEELTEFALNSTNLASFGLRIIIENHKELDFNEDLLRQIFTGIISVARH